MWPSSSLPRPFSGRFSGSFWAAPFRNAVLDGT
jgi:hypothetical protein